MEDGDFSGDRSGSGFDSQQVYPGREGWWDNPFIFHTGRGVDRELNQFSADQAVELEGMESKRLDGSNGQAIGCRIRVDVKSGWNRPVAGLDTGYGAI